MAGCAGNPGARERWASYAERSSWWDRQVGEAAGLLAAGDEPGAMAVLEPYWRAAWMPKDERRDGDPSSHLAAHELAELSAQSEPGRRVVAQLARPLHERVMEGRAGEDELEAWKTLACDGAQTGWIIEAVERGARDARAQRTIRRAASCAVYDLVAAGRFDLAAWAIDDPVGWVKSSREGTPRYPPRGALFYVGAAMAPRTRAEPTAEEKAREQGQTLIRDAQRAAFMAVLMERAGRGEEAERVRAFAMSRREGERFWPEYRNWQRWFDDAS